jgi:predicted nucleic acid binding AN1-type Zn finger protein
MPRCAADGCKKKLALSDMPCKCKSVYCSLHRMPETHACSFDYQEAHKTNLLKYMSTAVIAKKVEVI